MNTRPHSLAIIDVLDCISDDLGSQATFPGMDLVEDLLSLTDVMKDVMSKNVILLACVCI